MIQKSGWMQVILTLTLKASGMMTGTKQWVLSQRYLHSFSRHGESTFTLASKLGWSSRIMGMLQHHHRNYNWGGSYIHAATGTDNPKHVKDIILALTANKDNLLKISKDYSDFTNTKSGMKEAAKDDSTSHQTSLADRTHLLTLNR